MKKEGITIKNNLAEAPANKNLVVLQIESGGTAKQRLISMGIHAGDKIIKYNGSSWGPVLIKNLSIDSTKIAIGKGLATKIQVTYETP